MTDLGPMKPCPHSKKGHKGDSFVTLDEQGVSRFAWSCRRCGASRLRGPEAFEELPPLDSLSADEIERAFFGAKR
jgi:hypothetical protein